MSWQGNECFIECIEYEHDGMEGMMLDAMSALLWLYGNHGRGWFLLGYFNGGDEREWVDDFELRGDWGYGWLENPFMHPDVMAVKIKNPHDLISAAFECFDSRFDFIAYAGDGDEPLEHMVVRGEEYDMRPREVAA